MKATVKTFKIGRLFIGFDISERGTPWVTYENRKRRDHLFSINRVYDRESGLYAWQLFLYRLSVAFAIL